MTYQEELTSYVASFVSELVQTGVRDVVISPGSRSTPIAMVMAEHPTLRTHIQVDERSAAFFALGIAKQTGLPTVLLCTSGTAAANYFPAIAEAKLSRVPLVVLTADRPHELRDVGAPQAMDQVDLYGKHVKWFVEMAPPEGSTEMLRYVRNVAARAVATAGQVPCGPVHLNFPLREPLVPLIEQEPLFAHAERQSGFVAIEQGKLTLSSEQFARISSLMEGKRGIMVCGELAADESFATNITKLATQLGFPILADPLSNLRSGTHSFVHIIDSYDSILRNADAKRLLKPEVIIRFGAMPISKALTLFIKDQVDALQIVVDGGAGWRDPSLLSTHMIHCDETEFCTGLLPLIHASEESSYVTHWQELNSIAKQALQSVSELTHLNEARLFYELNTLLPDGATLFVGNSMPIRDVDTFFFTNNKSIKIVANRGANGIDGVISTALGVASVNQPTYLVLGDLTFFHDLNGLIAAKLYHIPLQVIVINNNGGGIFSFLPQANSPKHFEKLFGTPLDLDFEHAVTMYGGHFERVQSWSEFTSSFTRKLENPALSVVEVPTNREQNLQEHRNLWNFVSQEISRYLDREM